MRPTSEELRRCSFRRYKYNKHVAQIFRPVSGNRMMTAMKPKVSEVMMILGLRNFRLIGRGMYLRVCWEESSSAYCTVFYWMDLDSSMQPFVYASITQ